MKYFLCLFLFLTGSALNAQSEMKDLFDDVIDLHRKAIYLSSALDDSLMSKPKEVNYTSIGLKLNHRKIDLLDELSEKLDEQPKKIRELLRLLEDTVDVWDVDKLAFQDLITSLLDKETKYNSELRDAQKALDQIQRLYEEELKEVFGKLGTRGILVRRKMWKEYLNFVKNRYQLTDLIKQYAANVNFETTPTRGGVKSLWGYKMPAKTVVLTFDDGPHYKHTGDILKILKEKDVPGIFFQLSKNIVTEKGGKKVERSGAKFSREISKDPRFLLGNHSTTHPLLTKLDSGGVSKEVGQCFDVLEGVVKDSTRLFRPPYGGVNTTVRSALKALGTQPFMWNIDSRDWADPVPASIASRVVADTKKQGRGVILLHDIHRKTVEALPMIIDSLKAEGFEFVLWDGKTTRFHSEKVAARGDEKKTGNDLDALYHNKWALIVGINEYKNWPALKYAVNDAKGIQEVLIKDLGFNPENIALLTDQQATRKQILNTFYDHLIENPKMKENDGVFVFFAGHGMTRSLSMGKSAMGAIVPVDADNASYISQAISMSEVEDLNAMIPAKHVFWVMDACYSGLALTRSGNTRSYDSQRYLHEVSSRRARQIITAGGADEEVADGGPSGHSIFTWTLINALSGDADLNGDGYVVASEIYNYVPPYVSSFSNQTPAFGNLVGSSGGDFIFQLKKAELELTDNATQYDDETSELMAEIERLKNRLAAIQSKKEEGTRSMEDTLTLQDRIGMLNSQGLKLFRQKKYEESLSKFQQASDLDPTHVQSVNNVGFLYYKLDQLEKAREWIEKAIELDDERAVAYLNLADIQVIQGEKKEAIENYEVYLSLVKESDFTKKLKEKVEELRRGE